MEWAPTYITGDFGTHFVWKNHWIFVAKIDSQGQGVNVTPRCNQADRGRWGMLG